MTTCGICCEDLDQSNTLWLDQEFKSQLIFCSECLKYMIKSNFSRYIQEIEKADCEKSLGSALSDPIPLYITQDTLKKSKQIIQVYLLDGSTIDCKLEKPIDDLTLANLNLKLSEIKFQMDQDPTFDYLDTIKKLLEEFSLNNIS